MTAHLRVGMRRPNMHAVLAAAAAAAGIRRQRQPCGTFQAAAGKAAAVVKLIDRIQLPSSSNSMVGSTLLQGQMTVTVTMVLAAAAEAAAG
jgi:hypothetical protein